MSTLNQNILLTVFARLLSLSVLVFSIVAFIGTEPVMADSRSDAHEIVAESLAASSAESLTTTLEGCRKLLNDFDAYNVASENQGKRRIDYGFAHVPKRHDGSPETLPVFWWVRKMLRSEDNTNVPLVYIHGGVGLESWRAFREHKTLMEKYPGDYLAFDHRGEGCSKRMASNLDPMEYEQYRLRYVYKDVEYLRTMVLNYPRWRMFGNSRGATIIMHYLANYAQANPRAVEAAHLHGNVLMPSPETPNLIRQRSFYKTGQFYLNEFPEDALLLANIRLAIGPGECWTGVDDVKICGPVAPDLLSFSLTNKRKWPDIHVAIQNMLTDGNPDLSKIRTEMQKHSKIGYANFVTYILGVNLRDTGSMPSPDQNEHGELTNDPSYEGSFLSENRLLLKQIYPFHQARGLKIPHSGVDPISYSNVIEGLKKSGAKLFYYQSIFDPIGNETVAKANLKAFAKLENLFSYIELKNSSHDGWYTEPRVVEELLKPSQP